MDTGRVGRVVPGDRGPKDERWEYRYPPLGITGSVIEEIQFGEERAMSLLLLPLMDSSDPDGSSSYLNAQLAQLGFLKAKCPP